MITKEEFLQLKPAAACRHAYQQYKEKVWDQEQFDKALRGYWQAKKYNKRDVLQMTTEVFGDLLTI